MFLTSVWSKTPMIVDAARLTKYLIDGEAGRPGHKYK